MDHAPTKEQTEIRDTIADPKAGNLAIDALAGSGKTSTILWSIESIPQKSILISAFNKRIAEDIQHKLPKMPKTHAVHVKTFHSLGMGIIRANHPHLCIADHEEGGGNRATEDIVTKVCEGRGTSYQQKRWIGRLLKLCKETMIDPVIDPDDVRTLADTHEIFGTKATEDDIERVIDRVLAAYGWSQDPRNLTYIDFCDQVWLPVVANMRPSSRYQAIMVDEMQDISRPQFALVQLVALPKTRWIVIGDKRQAIYGWRGGLGEEAWTIMTEQYNAETKWLTTTFRSAHSIVREANRVLHLRGDMAEHALKALPEANEGTVTTIALADLPNQFVGGTSDVVHTFVLSRRNDDLLKCALFLHRSRVKFQLIGGKDMLAPIFDLLDYKLDQRNAEAFIKSLTEWKTEQLAKAEKLGSWSLQERVEEQYRMIVAAHEATGFKPWQVKGLLGTILSDLKSGVWLLTVHKAKGLEAQRVFLLKQSFVRHSHAMLYGENIKPPIEELNIEYVAITRAKEHLVWVDLDPSAEGEVDLDEAVEALKALGAIRKLPTEELEKRFAKAEREAQRLEDGSADDLHDAEIWTKYASKLLEEIQLRSRTAKGKP